MNKFASNKPKVSQKIKVNTQLGSTKHGLTSGNAVHNHGSYEVFFKNRNNGVSISQNKGGLSFLQVPLLINIYWNDLVKYYCGDGFFYRGQKVSGFPYFRSIKQWLLNLFPDNFWVGNCVTCRG